MSTSHYENRLLLLLGVSFGFAFFDRNSASVLIPYMAKDLALTNTRAALINSVLSVMWALGAYLIARWSDSRGSRKPFLPAFLVIFSACAPSCPVWRRRSGFCCLHVGSWA